MYSGKEPCVSHNVTDQNNQTETYIPLGDEVVNSDCEACATCSVLLKKAANPQPQSWWCHSERLGTSVDAESPHDIGTNEILQFCRAIRSIRFNTALPALFLCTVAFLTFCILVATAEGNKDFFSAIVIASPQYTNSTYYVASSNPVFSNYMGTALWQALPIIVGLKPILKFTLGRHHPAGQAGLPMIAQVDDNTTLISGTPKVCTENFDKHIAGKKVFTETTDLYLCNINNCFNYIHAILNIWAFPKIQNLKLHRMIIKEQEFMALTNFIQRHNHTIKRVEIDNCYLCLKPKCNLNLINYPSHKFQLKITRIVDRPEWIQTAEH